MISLEKQIQRFLATRKLVFPKFALCSDQKLKYIFSNKTMDWASFLFPQVHSLTTDAKGVIRGFTTAANVNKTFLSPVPTADTTTDYVACRLLASLREAFRDEIYQIAVVQKRQGQSGGQGGQGPKQDNR